MALGDAILVCLTERSMSGYDLAKRFDESIGFFWRADHQQIYRELSRLRQRGEVSTVEVIQSGRPNKLVYSITEAGRAALKRWSREPSAPQAAKDDLLVRLYAIEHVDREAVRAQLAARLAHHTERLARYEHILQTRYGGQPTTLRLTGRLLVLEMGLRNQRAWVEWCELALGRLEKSAG